VPLLRVAIQRGPNATMDRSRKTRSKFSRWQYAEIPSVFFHGEKHKELSG